MVMDIKEVAKWLRGEQAVYEEAREYNRKHENRQSMLRANAQAEEMSAMAESCERFTWRPIHTAPKDGTTVWLGCAGSMRLGYWMSGDRFEHHGSIGGGWRDEAMALIPSYVCDLRFAPAHWMPLPAAPQP